MSVVIVTYERPEYLERCLQHIGKQLDPPDEVLVVDASVSDASRRIAQDADVTYIANPAGRGSMTNSRNVGWRASRSDIVAFVDDDAFAAPDWSQQLVSAYRDATIGGVGGRAIRSELDVPRVADRVGALTPDGRLIANFDTIAPGGLDVCHLIGCNMSFRRSLLEQVGGFREDYLGTEVREETDLCFRVIEAGYRLRYEPDALVVHVGGPYVRGRRFDVRYDYFMARNHAQLLVRHFGVRAPVVRGFASGLTRHTTAEGLRHLAASFVRWGANILGFVVGTVAGLRSPDSPKKPTDFATVFSDWIERAPEPR